VRVSKQMFQMCKPFLLSACVKSCMDLINSYQHNWYWHPSWPVASRD